METTTIALISFTEKGQKLAETIREKLERSEENICVKAGRKPGQSLKDWCSQAFSECQVLIFVGAVGIAVRTIAPFVKDKFTDPAVLVLDEQGNFVIPILSGHVGGGNEWANFLAQALLAVPVITTATDLYGKFAVDVFAAKQKLVLSDRVLAKEISAAVLRGERIGFFCEGKVIGKLPEELLWENEKMQSYHIVTGVHQMKTAENTLCLYPKAIVIGIGCKKGKTLEEIEDLVCRVLEKEQIAMESVCCLASVDRKKDEPGILEFSRKYQLPFQTFSSQQLKQVPGEFAESEFVKEAVGIGNVCERAAIRAAMEINDVRMRRTDDKNNSGQLPLLIRKKTAEHGITVALAEAEWSVKFE